MDPAINIDAEDARDTRDARHQHHQFYMQAGFSGVGVVFAAVMLLIGKEPSIYLPIFTSILFSWLPSPLSGSAGQSTLKRLADAATANVPFMVASRRPNGIDATHRTNPTEITSEPSAFKVHHNASFDDNV
jgi:hypothetical protein